MSDNASVVISSHLVEELERIIDKAIFMKDGQIVLMGDVEEIRQEPVQSPSGRICPLIATVFTFVSSSLSLIILFILFFTALVYVVDEL